MNKSKGFTLIELLVVIAIIGILSGLIIVSMNGATSSAKDSRIKENMHQLQQYAAIYSNAGANSYGTGAAGADTNFTGTGDGLMLYNDLTSASLGSKTMTLNFSPSTGISTAYCMSIPLNTLSGSNTQYECMDSTGNVKVGTTGVTCDSTAVCVEPN